MKVCTYTNLCAGSALILVLGFAACAGNAPAPAASPVASGAPPASAAPASSAPAAGSAAPDDTGAAGAGDSAGGDDSATAPAKGKPKETRTVEVIAEFIKAHRKPFRACYDKAHKQLPDIKGNMTLHFILDPQGNVKSAKLNDARSDIKAPLAVDCAIKELKKLKFPPSSIGMQSEINYPFNFKPH